MAITTKTGSRFTQVLFSTGTGELWAMSEPKIMRSVRLTALPGQLVFGTDYITFGEVGGEGPDLFVLSADALATIFHGSKSMRLAITDYLLTNPADVVVSLEYDAP